MRHDFRERAVVKAAAILIFIAAGTAAFFGLLYCGYYWDSFFHEGGYTSSSAYYSARNESLNQLENLMTYQGHSLYQEGGLTYLERQEYDELKEALSPENTNFRYIVRDNITGEMVLSSTGEDSLTGVTDLWRFSGSWGRPVQCHWDEDRQLYVYVDSQDNELFTSPTNSQNYPSGLAVECGVDETLPVRDTFWQARETYAEGDEIWIYATAGTAVLAAVTLIFLMGCAGRRRNADEFVLNWQDRIPYDLYFCVVAGSAAFCLVGAAEIATASWNWVGPKRDTAFFFAGTVMAAVCGLTAGGVMSTASRLKTHTLLRNTVIWRLCGRLWRMTVELWLGMKRFFTAIFGQLPLTGRVMAGFACWLLLNGFLAAGLFLSAEGGWYLFLLMLLNGAMAFVLCRWTLAWASVREGAQAIVGGRPDAAIDTAGMKYFPSLREHAGQLNDLGNAINMAVEERMKSERMKAELITNVSHDLKTPLTSIINYVDLLKKENLESETVRGYIDVLDRKSQRLKKLTEDLVEASKASTGTLAVNLERLGMGQLVKQALGEYEEKLSDASLTPVLSTPEKEVWVSADGRHLWRVLDNLMGNCVKYAMPGTRVYLDVLAWDGKVIVSVKNISARQLNVPPETLMERFVRGDESRSTEGSGLGLSIARSLTELQGGTFRLDVDGDLFKVVVTLPEADGERTELYDMANGGRGRLPAFGNAPAGGMGACPHAGA